MSVKQRKFFLFNSAGRVQSPVKRSLLAGPREWPGPRSLARGASGGSNFAQWPKVITRSLVFGFVNASPIITEQLR